jgi:hypothetical protein
MRFALARRAALALACIVAAALAVWSIRGWAWRIDDTAVREVAVTAYPIPHFRRGDPSVTRFGPLEYVGGFEMRGSHGAFGGLSGLRLGDGGETFIAASDVGDWFTGRIAYDAAGRPTGWRDVRVAAIRDVAGGLAKDGRLWDAESLALRGGSACIGFERVHQVHCFAFARDGFAARAEAVPVPTATADWPDNNGPEAIGILPPAHPTHGGELLMIQERPWERDGPSEAFVLGPRGFRFEVARRDRFDITDVDFLPSGDMILLERWFNPLRGVAMRLRRIRLADIRPGARVDGEILLVADSSHHIDNMEGLSIHRRADGAVILSLVSDDNFSAMQRSLFLQFRWMGD